MCEPATTPSDDRPPTPDSRQGSPSRRRLTSAGSVASRSLSKLLARPQTDALTNERTDARDVQPLDQSTVRARWRFRYHHARDTPSASARPGRLVGHGVEERWPCCTREPRAAVAVSMNACRCGRASQRRRAASDPCEDARGLDLAEGATVRHAQPVGRAPPGEPVIIDGAAVPRAAPSPSCHRPNHRRVPATDHGALERVRGRPR